MEPLATQKPGRQESGPVATAQQAPREAGSEFELRHQQTVSDLTSQLHTTPGTAYQSFEQPELAVLLACRVSGFTQSCSSLSVDCEGAEHPLTFQVSSQAAGLAP
ncbi:hypothetical protein AB1E18_005256 [Capra hircus]